MNEKTKPNTTGTKPAAPRRLCTVCKGLAAGMIGVSFALLVHGQLLAYIAVFAAAALLAWAVER